MDSRQLFPKVLAKRLPVNRDVSFSVAGEEILVDGWPCHRLLSFR